MDVRILGSLEVLADGHPVSLGGPKQRALFALLLLNANQVVSSERLLDELWGERPPASGMTALQVRVSQLRRALEQADDERDGGLILATRAPGYVIRLDEDLLDAHRFERLLAEGKEALARGEAALAAERLQNALALWRGPALADVAAEPFVQAEIARLEELRLTALEARIEADLALGRHAELVAELEALTAQHPLREGLRAQLMLALYRSGRQADALEAYRDGRSLLVETLGLEPGEALRRLEAAILRHDPALEPPTPQELSGDRKPAPPALAGEERKVVTVLFADVVGSTELVTSQDPEQARALLDRLWHALAAEIDEAGGTVEKFIGDAVMAVFGAPVAQEDHVERALHTALALIRRTSELFGETISLGIGITTGEVVVGRAREGGSLVTGTAVNLADRLERAAEPGEILVDIRSAQAARGAFEFASTRRVEAKGFAGGIECRPLVRALALTRRRGVGGLEPVFVGRDGEIELLRATYRRVAQEGRPALVSVVGDAGVGKSALVRRFWDWLPSQQPEPLRRTGQCLSYGRALTYRPLGDVLREQLGLLATDPPAVVLDRLRGREILGLTFGLDVVPDLHPLAAREELHETLVDFLEELVGERPAVVLVEDLHWAEEPLLDLLERLVRDVGGPLMLVATARPELLASRPSWGGGSRDALTIGLEPLPRADSELLLDELVAGALPQPLCERLVERSEGNPFFAEELLGALVDQGYVARHGSAWSIREVHDLTIPDSLHDVLAARIDLLPAPEKEALQAAAVIGRTFWRGAVRQLVDGTPPDLAALERRDFVRRRSTSSVAGEREFTFKHALTREVAYAGIPKARRARLHAAFAEWLERVGEQGDEQAPLLAHHYAESVRPDDADLVWRDEPARLEALRQKALAWLRRAADLAASRYEIDEALALLQRALPLTAGRRERAEVWRAIARGNALKYAGEPFWTAMQRAIAEADDAELEAELYADLAYETALRSGIWRRMPERETVGGWIERALAHSPAGSRARAKALVARARWIPGDPEAAAAAAEASAIGERSGDPELRSAAWDARGIVLFVAGEYEQGRSWEERRFELLDQISDPDVRADIHAAPITGCIWSGRFREARRLARAHTEIASKLTSHHRVHAVAIELEVEELLGRWDVARNLQERAKTAVEANLDTPCVRNPRALLVCALANECLGKTDAARAFEERALELWMDGYGFTLDTPLLRLALARADLEQVERLLARPDTKHGWHRGWFSFANITARLDALAALGNRPQLEAEAPPYLRRQTYLEPFALRALGQVRKDEELIRRASERFDAIGLDWHKDQTKRLLSA